ncbi:uncharacterized protein LOC113225457 [Hyposmocoma kahamanoa]|uniref:uncharacterized protein LOC113225457 n=1 Tax=Hyposmocoma kahamanoa TaxID=1477025 RepID=UPI000E6D9C16|nr:uncharacterized protein LOC113225457 [Hyposmocoma kahamanoa]
MFQSPIENTNTCENFVKNTGEGVFASTASAGSTVAGGAGAVTTTPAALVSSAASSSSAQFDISQITSLFDARFEKLDAKLDTFCVSISKDIKTAIEQLKLDFTRTTDFLEGKISDVEGCYKNIKDQVLVLQTENSKLHTELFALKTQIISPEKCESLQQSIAKLQYELNEKEQEAIINDIEIGGVPEYHNESAAHLITTIAAKIGVNLDTRDIVSATREGLVRPTRVGDSRGPRRVIVRLSRRAVRDELLRAARSRRNTDTTGLGLPSHDTKKVYINERLTKTNRILFAKARAARVAMNWRFVWTREGRIFARKSDSADSPTHRVRCEEDIDRIFNNTHAKQVQ